MRSVIIPVNEGGFLAATIWERSDAKAIVLLHPATAVVQGFYKDSQNIFLTEDSTSSHTIIAAPASLNPGWSVLTAFRCLTGSTRTSDV